MINAFVFFLYSNRWKSETSEEDEESDSENSSDRPRRKRRLPINNRRKKQSSEEESRVVSRRKTNTVSYKEASEDEPTDSEDLVEIEHDEETIQEEDKSETIERVVGKRIGRKGATGSATTIYEVDEHGDPNEGCDETDPLKNEVQYLIKWKGWSHIHNTWE